MNNLLPSSICVSFDQEQDRDGDSELARSQYGDAIIPLTNGSCSNDRLDESHTSQTEKHDVVYLQYQIAAQKARLKVLSLHLSQCQVENEALKSEKEVLISELALATQTKPAKRKQWFSKEDGGGSMQLLVNTNADLMAEISRLQVAADVTRKSYHSHITDSRRAIKDLQRENETFLDDLLLQPLEISDREKNSLGVATSTTSSSFMSSIYQQDINCDSSGDGNEEIHNRIGSEKEVRRSSMPASGEIKNSDTGTTCRYRRNSSADLIVDFAETRRPSSLAESCPSNTEGVLGETRRRSRSMARSCHSDTEGIAEDLLFDLGELQLWKIGEH